MSYILITPCRNEESNIPVLYNAIIMQSKKPVLWVIVDDRSEDGTSASIANIEKEHPWIKGLYLTEIGEYMGSHYSRVCRQGFDFALSYCLKNGIDYEFIALIDADNIPENTYFEKLILELEINPTLGIVSGVSTFANLSAIKGNEELTKMFECFHDFNTELKRTDLPMGSARMWKKKCFQDTGGYLEVYAPDAVSNAKAKMKGWTLKRTIEAHIIEREAFEQQGVWKRSKEVGYYYYYLWHPLTYVILKSIKKTFHKPYYGGFRCLYGYIIAALSKRERIKDDDVRIYYQKVRMKEIISNTLHI